MAKMLVQPYLFFGGRCEEALEFYRTSLGAEVLMLSRFSESPEPHPMSKNFRPRNSPFGNRRDRPSLWSSLATVRSAIVTANHSAITR